MPLRIKAQPSTVRTRALTKCAAPGQVSLSVVVKRMRQSNVSGKTGTSPKVNTTE